MLTRISDVTRRLAVVNQKGGVGKTTTAVNLAVALATRGKRVLLIDCDPQGNASQFLGLADRVHDSTVYGTFDLVLGGRPFEPQNYAFSEGLHVIPATRQLADLELQLLRGTGVFKLPTRRLADALATIEASYDFVIADCAPTIGLTVVNAMASCPEIIIPVKLLLASLDGLVQLQQLIEGIRTEISSSIRILGILGTFFEETAKIPRAVLSSLRRDFGSVVFDTVIHKGQDIASAAGGGKPIVLASPKSRGATEYQQLTNEVIARGRISQS